jgi:hypothetical protein
MAVQERFNKKEKSMKKKVSLIIFISIVLVGLIMSFLSANASNAAQDKQDVQAALEKFYSVLNDVTSTYDVAKFSDILLDTGDCRPDEETRQFIEQTMGKDAAANAGYLTAMQAKYIARGKATKLLENATEKAKAENRELTQDEKQQVMDANGGIFPPTTIKPSSTISPDSSLSKKKALNFMSIEVIGDWGKIKYDTSQALQEATLARKNGRWFVACIKPIQVHY